MASHTPADSELCWATSSIVYTLSDVAIVTDRLPDPNLTAVYYPRLLQAAALRYATQSDNNYYTCVCARARKIGAQANQ